MSLGAIILAAGEGTRMRSDLPKMLHQLMGRPMIRYTVEAASTLIDDPPVLIIGRGAENIRQVVGDQATYVEQLERRGTGHAVLQARPAMEGRADRVLVLCGDMPLLREETLQQLAERQRANPGPITLLTAVVDNPRGFGRILRDENDRVIQIVEEAVATPEQNAIRELNAGIYCFDAQWLWSHVDQIPLSLPKEEYYLTDLVEIAAKEGQQVEAIQVQDTTEVLGINTRVHLAEAERALRRRVNRQWMESGVTMIDPDTTYIGLEVTVGPDTVIWPNTHLQGQTTVGAKCRIGPNSVVEDSAIGDSCRVVASVVESAVMEEGSNVGPFGHLRQGARLEAGAHMGNFGELKNTTLGPGAKMGHFSYLGDAQVGAGANIGAGTITCNFDGEQKHSTVIGEGAFIGSDTMLVAPINVGKGARTGAGSVVTKDVPDKSLAVGVPARIWKDVQE